jgi:PAP2 superfamily
MMRGSILPRLRDCRWRQRRFPCRHVVPSLLAVVLATVSPTARAQPTQADGATTQRAQGPAPAVGDSSAEPRGLKLLATDIKAYVTAPLHAKRPQWVRFGATLAAIGVAYEHDDNTRNHYVGAPPPDPSHDTHDSRDAVPAALALGGTWVAAAVLNDEDGRHEAHAMIEAAAFSSAAAYALKELAGRERPYVAGDSGNWRSGGDSFPSMHVTAAFAIGAVLAESGDERYRWLRRVLGYGLAAGTAVQRLKHDAHWLSDTVAGAGLGVATARFVMARSDARARRANFAVLPTDSGLVLTYNVALH